MVELQLICTYCDYHWTRVAYSVGSLKPPICDHCGDKNIRIKEVRSGKIDYYQGAPDFPPSSPKTDEDIDDYDNYL